MPGKRGKVRCLADVTIKQFADADEPVARPAKRVSDRRSVLCLLAAESNAAAAPGADAEDALTEEDDNNETDDTGETATDTNSKRANVRAGKKRRQAVAVSSTSITYPALIWQLLGDYIHPESVGAFAAVCRDARRATQQHAFWRRLYLRWAWTPAAEADASAPHELRLPAILACQRGVRPRVIRALHRWHFVDSGGVDRKSPPTGLRFLRFAVQADARRLLILFQRGPPPPPPRPPPDSWEAEAEADAAAFGIFEDRQRCPTEGQWLLVADLDTCGLSPSCLEDLLTLDSRCVMTGLRCLTAFGSGGCCKLTASGSARWCELLARLPTGDCRAISFACSSAPRLLPWWRPGFLPALRSSGDSGGCSDVVTELRGEW